MWVSGWLTDWLIDWLGCTLLLLPRFLNCVNKINACIFADDSVLGFITFPSYWSLVDTVWNLHSLVLVIVVVSAGVDINERAPFGLCFMSAESLWHVVSSFLLFFFVESPDPKQTEEEVGGGDGDEAGGRREHVQNTSASRPPIPCLLLLRRLLLLPLLSVSSVDIQWH